MVTMLVVVIHKTGNGLFQFPREIEIHKLDNRFHGTMVALDFALRLRMIGGTTNVAKVMMFKVLGQFIGHESSTIIGQQARTKDRKSVV